MRVLMLLDSAPDYREMFLRELGKRVELTVVARPCSEHCLSDPAQRTGYAYMEIPARRLGRLAWQPGLRRLIRSAQWDVICAVFNVRNLSRVWAYATYSRRSENWVWWGQVAGRAQGYVADAIRKLLLRNAVACLTYSEGLARTLRKRYGVMAFSFNNSEVSIREFRRPVYRTAGEDVRLLFVGRNQPRKRLERLIQMAETFPYVRVRLIGPGMERLSIPKPLIASGRVAVFGRLRDDDLNPHFDWADLVVSPGHVGLLVLNAARHGKAIAIDADSRHAPEVWLARKARQPFVSFGRVDEVSRFLEYIRGNREQLKRWGKDLQDLAKAEWTIEHMVEVHLRVFEMAARRDLASNPVTVESV